MLRSDSGKKVWPRLYVLALLTMAFCAISIKLIYLNTAESRYNAEELPLPPMALVGGSEAVSNVAATRLYGTANITTAVSLKAFGFSVFALKAPNMLFFLLTLVFLYIFSLRYFARLDNWSKWYALMPSALLCLGPPVIQIWGMKNRGGFIENILALTICLWICATPQDGRLSSMQKLLLAIVIGIATWSQPIAILWGAVIVAYIMLSDLLASPRSFPRNALVLGFGLAVGLLPLIALNFLFRFNTIRVIDGGETPGGVDLGNMGRLQQIVVDGIPRLLGLKEQWNPDWIFAPALAYLLYVIFMLPAVVATVRIAWSTIQGRRLTLGLALVAVAAAVIVANVFSSWGNFQSEPRRLLMLYIPLAVLTSCGLSRAPRFAIAYLMLWIATNFWSNYAYISKHPDGFSHSVYQPLHSVAALLKQNGVVGVYSDVWTGGPITFASEGAIPWFRSKYLQTSYGFIGDDELNSKEAMVFNANTPGGTAGQRKFSMDIRRAGIHCTERKLGEITVFYGCDREFKLSKLEMTALRLGAVPGNAAIELEAADPKIVVKAGTRDNDAIVANGAEGYLVYGPYSPLPAGNYSLVVAGASSDPFILDLAADRGRSVLAKLEMRCAENSAENILVTMDFELKHSVDDFEVRIRVPAKSNARISGYKVIYR